MKPFISPTTISNIDKTINSHPNPISYFNSIVEDSLRKADIAAAGIEAAHAALDAIGLAKDSDGGENSPLNNGYIEGCFLSSIEAHVQFLHSLHAEIVENYEGFKKAMVMGKGCLSSVAETEVSE